LKRIVYTAALGRPEYAEMALGLARSLSYCGDETERAIVTDIRGYDWERHFTYVLPVEQPLEWVFFSKLDLLKRTDADQVLWVDSDCLAFRPVKEIFDWCAGKGFAAPGFPAREGAYYGEVLKHLDRHGLAELPKVTAGLLYYERSRETEKFIEQVYEYGRNYESLGFERRTAKLIPDEPCISLAMAKGGFGSLIPETTQFIHSAAGLVGKLTLDVARNRCEFACLQETVRYFRPAIFHAWRYKDFSVYWRQLKRLRMLEEYADTHESMYMPASARLVRSVQRRLLRLGKSKR
jgi:hypothetical protein